MRGKKQKNLVPSPLRKLISAKRDCVQHTDIPPLPNLADFKFSQ